MATLHGSWITETETQKGHFFIWGETWRPYTSQPSDADTLPSHPFALTQEELLSWLESHELVLDKVFTSDPNDRWHSQVLSLPSQDGSKDSPPLPLLSGQIEANTPKSLNLQTWQVAGFSLSSLETTQFLQLLPLSSLQTQNTFVGSDLSYWAQIYRWSLDLLARSKFLPNLDFRGDNGSSKAYWQPLLDSAIDQARFSKFTSKMPDVCRAYLELDSDINQISEWIEPQVLLLDFLSHILDAQLRSWATVNPTISKVSLVFPWLEGLSQESAAFEIEDEAAKRLDTALQNWTVPIQEYLGKQLLEKLGKNQFRLAFRLQPPTEGELNWGRTHWKLQYGLQAFENPNCWIDAEVIWQHPVNEWVYEGRSLKNPQEMFLKGLGLAARIYDAIEESLNAPQPTHAELDPIQVYQFIRSIAGQLEDNGMGVILPPGLAKGETEKRLGLKIKAQLPKRNERLGLQSLLKFKLELAFGDKSLSKADFERLLDQKSPLVQVGDEWIALQPADVRAAQEVLASSDKDMSLSVEDAVRLSAGETKTMAKLPVVNFEASGALQELITNLTDNRSIEPIETPKEFKGELRPYQARGAGWLTFLERWGLGACLADDMGLGKTIQLIAFVLHLKQNSRLNGTILLICPTSVIGNWEREVKRFSPTLSTLVHHGDKRSKGKEFVKEAKNKDLVITSYPLVYRDEKTLQGIEWEGVVLDEAQNIKNSQAKQSKAVRNLKAQFRIALTGTPVENRLSELWSILDFLNPGYLGNKQFFQRRFAMPIEKYGDRNSLLTLRSLVHPFILRRLKTDKNIIQDLPEKQEMNVFCGLSEEQASLYQKLVDASLEEIEEAEGIQRHGKILTLILRLKQLCNHPALYQKEKSLNSAQRSGKLLRLEEMVEELVSEGDRALIFTQFSEWGKLLQPYLANKLDEEVLFIYGATRRQQREEIIDRFQNDPNAPHILILSLKAGGTGLNLTRANHVFHVDRWWNPAVENQATDRAFRIGQKQNVQVHKFVCNGTLEERINDIIESKKELAEQTVDAGEQWLTQMDTDQLRSLLLLDRSTVIDE
ncbi:MAG: DEAD/DEAH box helicase [Chroococcales cyanobacterium]